MAALGGWLVRFRPAGGRLLPLPDGGFSEDQPGHSAGQVSPSGNRRAVGIQDVAMDRC